MKFGFLCSAGGSPIYSALDILFSLNVINKSDVKILTDRYCGAVGEARIRNLTVETIEWTNTVDFSLAAFDYFHEFDIVLLLYSRIVDKALFENITTLNIHPSLLPSFKGIKALEQAIKCGVKYFGATLHMVNEGIDNGALIAQTISPLPYNADKNYLSKISYLQKTYLVLLCVDLILNNALSFSPKTQSFVWNKKTCFSQFANPKLITSNIQERFDLLFEAELMEIQ